MMPRGDSSRFLIRPDFAGQEALMQVRQQALED
jgi:hypothetical protein